MNDIVEDGSRNDPTASTKDVGVFKTSTLSGNVGVMDVGDRAKTYIIDLDEIDALTVLGKPQNHAPDFYEIMGLGQDGKRYQNKELGLIDNETGEVDTELKTLIEVAALNADVAGADIRLREIGSEKGDTYVEIEIGGRWSTDILRFEGDQLNSVLADLSDIEAICEALPTTLDLKNKDSQIAVMTFDTGSEKYFSGDDGNVDSTAVKQILGGSKMEMDEAVELTQYALSADGQADAGISVDFNGTGVIVTVETQQDSADTFVFKGDAFYGELNTTTFDGNPIVDLKNSASQIGVFDFDDANSFFHGSDSDVDSAAARAILGGSRLDAGEAAELVALAQGGTDPNVRYLGGDDNSAIIAIDASRDTVDTLFISGDVFSFV